MTWLINFSIALVLMAIGFCLAVWYAWPLIELGLELQKRKARE